MAPEKTGRLARFSHHVDAKRWRNQCAAGCELKHELMNFLRSSPAIGFPAESLVVAAVALQVFIFSCCVCFGAVATASALEHVLI